MSSNLITCETCHRTSNSRGTKQYFCPRCHAFLHTLYVREHAAPRRAKTLTMGEIRMECALAGLPFGAVDYANMPADLVLLEEHLARYYTRRRMAA